jgi:hypothetical protein
MFGFGSISRLGLLVAGLVSVLVTGCQVTTRAVAKERAGAELLFNGKDLAGWAGVPGLWTVEDGAITGTTTAINPIKNNTFLVWTNGTVENFELRFKYRIFNGNSGVQYRSKVLDAEKAIVGGYQADLEAGKTYSGILYEEQGRGILALRGQRTRISEVDGKTKVTVLDKVAEGAELQQFIREEEWNDYLIVANGNHFFHYINGKLMSEVIDDQPAKAAKSGVLALQVHAGPPMKVQFREMYLKRLP